MENGAKNTLIEYTKWILKGGYIIILGLCVLGGTFWSYGTFTQMRVPMIALNCKFFEIVKDTLGEEVIINDNSIKRSHNWIIMKQRFNDEPEGLYQGPHHKKDFDLSTSVTDLYHQADFTELNGENYIFYNGKYSTSINRKTLKMTHYKPDILKAHFIQDQFSCEKISTDNFYESVKSKVDKKKKGLRF